MIVELIVFGVLICLTVVNDDIVIYRIEDGEMKGYTAKAALDAGFPRETWDENDSVYQNTKKVVDEAIAHFQTIEIQEGTMKLTQMDRNINQNIIVYKATLIAMTDYLKRSAGDIVWIPCDYEGEDWIADLKSLVNEGLQLMNNGWDCEESSSWWNEVKDHVPKMWI